MLSFSDVLIQAGYLICRRLILPNDANVRGVSTEASCPDENAWIWVLAFSTICQPTTSLLEQSKVLGVSIVWKSARDWTERSLRCFHTPIGNSTHLRIGQKHFSQLFKCGAMIVEVHHQFRLRGWSAAVAQVENQTNQHRKGEDNSEETTNNFSFHSHFMKPHILTTRIPACDCHPDSNLTIKVEICTRDKLDLRPQILNLTFG